MTTYPVIHPMQGVKNGEKLVQIERGEGVYLYDSNGKRYLDGISGLWNVPLGYQNERLKEALINQFDKLPYLNLKENSNPVLVQLAEVLLGLTDFKFSYVNYVSSGSEAIELSLKIARKYHKLKKINEQYKTLVIDHSYHGSYFGSMTASSLSTNYTNHYEPMLPGFLRIPNPNYPLNQKDTLDLENSHLENLEMIFNYYKGQVGSVIIEPFIGSGGALALPKAYLKKLRKLCDQNDVILIFDEVATGFCRTGKMFAYEHSQVTPDVICLSKGINNGYLPFGAVLINEKIANIYKEDNSAIEHLSTPNGNPLAAALALETINIFNEEGYVNIVEDVGKRILIRMKEKFKQNENIIDIRGYGMMYAFSLINQFKKTSTVLTMEEVTRLVFTLKDKGLTVSPFHSGYESGINLFPPFVMKESEINEMIEHLDAVFSKMKTTLVGGTV